MNAPLIEPTLANQGDGAPVFAVRLITQMRHTPAHAHERGQIIAATAGVLAITTEDQHLIVPSGHAIWLPPLHLHAQSPAGACQGWSAYIAPQYCRELPLRPQVIQVSGLLREAALRAASWLPGAAPDAAQERVQGVILDEVSTLPPRDFVLAMPTDRRLLKIASALINTPGDQRSMQEWAAWAGIAPRTLTRRFTIETGLSFSEWRQRAKLIRALELLAAGVAVTAVALELGYDSLSAFITMFRRHFGVPPGQFREVDALS